MQDKNSASVRLNKAGENLRTFVDLQQNKVRQFNIFISFWEITRLDSI